MAVQSRLGSVFVLIVGVLIGVSVPLLRAVEGHWINQAVVAVFGFFVGVFVVAVAVYTRTDDGTAGGVSPGIKIRKLVQVFMAVLAGFAGLLATSMVHKQNDLLDAQNNYLEQRGVEEVFMSLRTRYLEIGKSLPPPEERSAGPYEGVAELCEAHRSSIEDYWQQAFLEWYLVKGLVEAADHGALPGSRAGGRRDLLWNDFYAPALKRSLEQILMSQGLRSMLVQTPDLFGGKRKAFEADLEGLWSELRETHGKGSGEDAVAPQLWSSLAEVPEISGFGGRSPTEECASEERAAKSVEKPT